MTSSVSSLMHRQAFVVLVVLATFVLALLAALLFVFLWIAVSRAPSTTSKGSLGRSAAVVVLGDVGRSPRMCFHAQSLAEDGWRVGIVGYQTTAVPPPLRRSSVRLHHVAQPFARIIDMLPRTGGLFAIATAPLKVLGQCATLFWILATQVQPPPELIIVQTPPALPTLFIVRLVGLLLGSRVVIDWHNLGYSILALRFKPTSGIVRFAAVLERWTGRTAFAHLCVTNALRQHLIERWRIRGPVRVLYDRPPLHYKRATVNTSHRLYSSLLPSLQPSLKNWCDAGLTYVDGSGRASLRSNRPALVVSSTSWTADEDFGMLLRAASMYEKRARELAREGRRPSADTLDSPLLSKEDLQRSLSSSSPSPNSLHWSVSESKRGKNRRVSVSSDALPKANRLPKMLLIVTGKGELRDEYLRQVEKLEREEDWQWVRIRTAWLPIEDYPTLLGSADVGVSLHSSSSGMDLPMKVVDMLGCGLPVCALGFPCIGELVQNGQNGLVFYSDKELAAQLESLLAQHPEPSWLASRTASAPSLFPEDIARSPTVSTASSPVLGTPRSSSPPPSSSLLSSDFGGSSSPLPMFTLLQSPVSATFDLSAPRNGEQLPKSRNWSDNWKRVVRPLIMAADLEDESEARRHQRTPLTTTDKRRLGKASTPPRRRSSGEISSDVKSTPDKTLVDGVRRRRLLFDGGSEDDAADQGEGELRLRTASTLQSPADIHVGSRERIPGIQISAPTID